MSTSGIAETNTYLRIASLSIGLYEYILTLPAEWRMYKSQRSITQISTVCTLFILIRYSSILILFISNYGYFSTSFTVESCERFYLVAPVLKVVQTMVSQAILGFRTINISRRRPWVKWAVTVAFTITTALEWFTNMFHRNPITINGNCSAGNVGAHLSAWVYYLLSMLYDLITLSLSTWFLCKLNIRDTRFSRLPRIMLYDGLGYFVALTATNILNVILYRLPNPAVQSSGANLGFAIVWIMSQRILIHLREVASQSGNLSESVVITRNPQSKEVAKVVRSQTDSKMTNADVEMAVKVHVERSVDYDSPDPEYDRDQRKLSVAWDYRS